MAAEATKQAYSRNEIRRLLGVSERVLKGWEKQNLLTASDFFDFSDLLALRTLAELRKAKIPAAQIQKAIQAIRARLVDVDSPLRQLKIFSRGKRLTVHFEGTRMEAVSGQLLLNFDEVEIKRLLSFPGQSLQDSNVSVRQKQRVEAEQWFEKGLELEHSGASTDQVIAAYTKACELDPKSAGALVNLGTVYFNLRRMHEAETHYRRALEVDSQYSLAHYNLGNLFDEMGNRTKALEHYLAALQIHSNYADAHYNIALVYQSLGQHLKAVQHWKTYLKLDPNSSWAEVARRELSRLRDSTIVRGHRVQPE